MNDVEQGAPPTITCPLCGAREFEKRGNQRAYFPLGPDLQEDGWNGGDIEMDTTDNTGDIAGEDVIYCIDCQSEFTEDELRSQPEKKRIAKRLEYLRAQLRAERISWGELAELQGLAEHIPADDVELLEAAGVPEYSDE